MRREDGSPAIVKALKPFDDVEDELRGEHYLAWRRGEGAVRLLGRDGHRMLLEYAGETLLVDADHDWRWLRSSLRNRRHVFKADHHRHDGDDCGHL